MILKKISKSCLCVCSLIFSVLTAEIPYSLDSLLEFSNTSKGFVPVSFRESMERNREKTPSDFYDDKDVKSVEQSYLEFCENYPSSTMEKTFIPPIIHLIGFVNFFTKKYYMNNEVGIYRGSFDPPHKGHFETVYHALNSGLSRVIITYTDPNPSKPFRSNDHTRRLLLTNMFKDLDRVTVVDNSYKACIKELETDPQVKKIYQIIAADLLSVRCRPITSPTKLAYLVLPRFRISIR